VQYKNDFNGIIKCYTCNYELPSGGAICLVDEIVDLRLSSC
jgi:hypothetical protein